jgi:hypothetical protein
LLRSLTSIAAEPWKQGGLRFDRAFSCLMAHSDLGSQVCVWVEFSTVNSSELAAARMAAVGAAGAVAAVPLAVEAMPLVVMKGGVEKGEGEARARRAARRHEGGVKAASSSGGGDGSGACGERGVYARLARRAAR